MVDKVILHLPINTPEQIVIRDTLATSLADEFQAVVLAFEEVVKVSGDKKHLFPFSVMTVYVDELKSSTLEYFKEIASLIADKTGDSIVLQIQQETCYTATPK